MFGILGNTYGMGGMPPPPKPPVDQELDCQDTRVPSFFAPTLILAKWEGRTPAMANSVARSRNSFTGRPPLALESRADSAPQRSAGNLLPKPPPTYSLCTWRLLAGISRVLARSPPTVETACVEGQNSTLSPCQAIICP